MSAQTGEIRVSSTKRGSTIQAFNYTQGRYVSVGSVSGATYEKGNAAILKIVKGEFSPSLALTTAELEAARDLGATFLRAITPDKVTYAISLSDFEKYAERYSNSYYGEQLAVSVEYFAKTGNSKKRNSIMDNPKSGPGPEYLRPEAAQLPMFEFRQPLFDVDGNIRAEVRR